MGASNMMLHDPISSEFNNGHNSAQWRELSPYELGVDRLGKFSETADHIALIGNHLPRRCGIATFTADTRLALIANDPSLRVDTYVMDDGAVENYPPVVTARIDQDVRSEYRAAAHRINRSGARLAWLQHEFGIFGGSDGIYVLDLVEALDIPLVVTLHTVLGKPSVRQRHIIERLAAKAARLIVMAEHPRDILHNIYGIDDAKILMIPHGIPDLPYRDPDEGKDELDLAGRKVILTFGLLSPDKGIGYMIEAMPQIVAACPEAIYVVLGATHPHLVKTEGEHLRHQLQDKARTLGMERHVRWVDQFVEIDALTRYLQAADVYVTPYLNPMQVTSGTLSYATGLGKPVVATPYIHARELLGDGTGVIVPFRNSAALATEVARLLNDDHERHRLAIGAYEVGRSMTWEVYARDAMRAFSNVICEKKNFSLNAPFLARAL